jgi:ABC-2 type transport system ATP-binding protein
MAVEKDVLFEASGLCFTYAGCPRPALQNVSFSISAGEFCGLIGPNGAGKTTLLSILTTLLRPGRGHLRMGDIDVLRTPRQVLNHIGYVPQDLALYERLTGVENLMFFGRDRKSVV